MSIPDNYLHTIQAWNKLFFFMSLLCGRYMHKHVLYFRNSTPESVKMIYHVRKNAVSRACSPECMHMLHLNREFCFISYNVFIKK